MCQTLFWVLGGKQVRLPPFPGGDILRGVGGAVIIGPGCPWKPVLRECSGPGRKRDTGCRVPALVWHAHPTPAVRTCSFHRWEDRGGKLIQSPTAFWGRGPALALTSSFLLVLLVSGNGGRDCDLLHQLLLGSRVICSYMCGACGLLSPEDTWPPRGPTAQEGWACLRSHSQDGSDGGHSPGPGTMGKVQGHSASLVSCLALRLPPHLLRLFAHL